MNAALQFPWLAGALLLLLASSRIAAPASEVLPPRPATTTLANPPVVPASQHWAFRPLAPVPLPQRRQTNPMDRFIADRLARKNLSLGPEADRATLLRRVALTLTGLPPTPDELRAFESDRRSGAYARMVDRYLASPRYGERWGKHWLEAAGYADSNGYFSADSDRPLAWRYRDWVVRSLNRDKPHDQFVREQIAGDELSGWRPGQPATPETIELLEATHFLRNGQDGSGESDGNPDEVRVDRYYALESAIQIMGSSLLGLTIQCAKCHDHKFEPFSQTEYYQLQAFLYPAFHIEKWVNPNDRIALAPLPGEMEAWEKLERRLDAELSSANDSFHQWTRAHRPAGKVRFRDEFSDAGPLTNRWSNTAPGDDRPGGSPPVALDSATAPAAQAKDGQLRIIEGGGSGDRWISTREAFSWRPARTNDWIQVTFDLVADRLSDSGPGADRVGYLLALHDFDDNSKVDGGNILIDGNPGGSTTIHLDYPGPDARSLGNLASTPYRPGSNYGVRVTRAGKDEFRLVHLVDGAPDGDGIKLKTEDLPDGGFGFEYCCGRSFVVDRVLVESSDRDNPEWAKLDDAFQAALKERSSGHDEKLRALAAQRTPKPGRIAWVSDLGPEPPEVRLLKRGSPKTPGELVEPGFPRFLPSSVPMIPTATKDRPTTGRRTAWAQWLTAPGSAPASLLARVTVNRVWQRHFGTGIAATTDNLGRSGTPPTHPELLDWLAADFVESGWSLKSLHRRILNSATFRQVSTTTPRALERDAANALLSRFPLQRLDADAIRDGMLAVAGKLGSKSSGPYVPTPRRDNGEIVPDESKPDALSRSLFLQQRRTQVPTFLGLFDAPSIVFNCTRRASTTMPLQALAQLNSEFAVQRAKDLAERLARDAGPDLDARLQLAWRLTSGRSPNKIDLRAARDFIAAQSMAYSPRPDASDRAWIDLCQSLLASNDFLYLR